MKASSAPTTSVETAPVSPAPAPTPTAAPASEYERFLAALPEAARTECQAKLTGSGLASNHPVFQVLAEFFENTPTPPPAAPNAASNESPRNFIQEAMLHANQAGQLLHELKEIPEAILARIEPQLVGLLSALTGPLAKLDATATCLQRNLETIPALRLQRLSSPRPQSNKWADLAKWWLSERFQQIRWLLSDHVAWIAISSICFVVTVTILYAGAANLSRFYEAAYQDRVAHMEAAAAADTVALNRLLAAGITLKVEQSPDREAWYLILPGARKAAQPVNSPEGLAVEVWP